MKKDGHHVTRARFEKDIATKLKDPAFAADIGSLLAAGLTWDLKTAIPVHSSRPITRLPGDPWKGER